MKKRILVFALLTVTVFMIAEMYGEVGIFRCTTYGPCVGECECSGSLWRHDICSFSCMDENWILTLCNFQSSPLTCSPR